MANISDFKYNMTSPENYGGLFQNANQFVGGTMGFGIVFTIWLISFFALRNYPNLDAVKSSTWIAWLTSMFTTLVNLTQPALSILLFILVLVVTGYSSRPRQ